MTPDPAHRALTEDQQGCLLRAAERRGARDHALVALALDTGLREGEIARLDDADVSITARAGHVRVAAGKAGMARQVSLRAQTRSAVTAWREHRGKASRGLRDPALFMADDGQRLSARSVDRVIREAGRAAGLDISPGTLRHTFATNLLRAGGSPVMVARLFGHASIDAARFYTPPIHKASLAHCCWQEELSRCLSETDRKSVR
jgi:site-specific recombinase XerD